MIIALLITLMYIVLIFSYRIGWYKLRSVESNNFSPKVSVIIALRNEEKEIKIYFNN